MFAVLNRATTSCVAIIAADDARAAMTALVRVAGEGQDYIVVHLPERQNGFTHIVAELPAAFDLATPLESFAMMEGLAEGPGHLVFFTVRLARVRLLCSAVRVGWSPREARNSIVLFGCTGFALCAPDTPAAIEGPLWGLVMQIGRDHHGEGYIEPIADILDGQHGDVLFAVEDVAHGGVTEPCDVSQILRRQTPVVRDLGQLACHPADQGAVLDCDFFGFCVRHGSRAQQST